MLHIIIDKKLRQFKAMLLLNLYCCSLQITGCTSPGKTVSIVVRGSNKLVIEEAERSIHDALCVIRCLVKKRSVISAELIFTNMTEMISKRRLEIGNKHIPPSLPGWCWHIHPLTKALLHLFFLQERNKQRNSTVESSPFVSPGCLSNLAGEHSHIYYTYPRNTGKHV